MKNPVTAQLHVTYDPAIALAICEAIASGKTVTDVAALDGMPSRNTIYRWLSVYPKFFDAFERAKEISALSLEEEALSLARKLAGPNDFTSTKVQAYNYAMQQLRWSASRRDKTRYGQAVAPTNVTVPIQINTTLNLGQEGQPAATDNAKSIYTIEAVVQPTMPEITDDDTDTVLDLTASGEVVDLNAEPDDNEPVGFDLPAKERQQLYDPREEPATARRLKRKSASAVARTKSQLATNARKRAAAKKEQD